MPIAGRVKPDTILQGDLIGCLASVALILLLPGSAAAIWIGTFGTGLFMASMFPTMISYAERRMALSGQITGLFFVASAAGSTTVPWLVGQMFEAIGPRITIVMAFAGVLAAALAFVGVRLSATPETAQPG
jgi:fucose permease